MKESLDFEYDRQGFLILFFIILYSRENERTLILFVTPRHQLLLILEYTKIRKETKRTSTKPKAITGGHTNP